MNVKALRIENDSSAVSSDVAEYSLSKWTEKQMSYESGFKYD